MEKPDQSAPTGVLLTQLVLALQDLRDALMDLSLMLHDFQFEADLPQRRAATELAQQLLMRIQTRA
jgi:hypothetical protein